MSECVASSIVVKTADSNEFTILHGQSLLTIFILLVGTKTDPSAKNNCKITVKGYQVLGLESEIEHGSLHGHMHPLNTLRDIRLYSSSGRVRTLFLRHHRSPGVIMSTQEE